MQLIWRKKADANRPKYVLLVNMALGPRTWGFFMNRASERSPVHSCGSKRSEACSSLYVTKWMPTICRRPLRWLRPTATWGLDLFRVPFFWGIGAFSCCKVCSPSEMTAWKTWEMPLRIAKTLPTWLEAHCVDAIPFPTRLEAHCVDTIPFPTRLEVHCVDAIPFSTWLEAHCVDAIPFPTRLEAHCADAMAFPTFLKVKSFHKI